jgi:predicted RNase H-like HicB family nuclease
MRKTRVEMRYDEKSGLHVAVAPDIYFCTGLGTTPEEARAHLEFAISRWFDSDDNPFCAPECGSVEPAS